MKHTPTRRLLSSAKVMGKTATLLSLTGLFVACGAVSESASDDSTPGAAANSETEATPAQFSDRRPGSLGVPGGGHGSELGSVTQALSITSEELNANGVPVDIERSLMINDTATLDNFTLKAVLDQLASQVGTAELTGLSIFQQLWATQNEPQCTTIKDNVTDAGLGHFACPRGEGIQAEQNPFLFTAESQPGTPAFDESYMATALVNRVDLIPDDGADCGEYRIIFARRSGLVNGQRAFMIFEAALPNPTPELGLEGCRPVQTFWRDLSTVTSVNTRVQRLQQFYFDGLPGFRPIIHVENFSDAGSGGQVRTNQFMDPIWMLREFKLEQSGSGNPATLVVQPVSVKSNPAPTLFDPNNTSALAAEFRNDFLAQVPNLAINNVNTLFMSIDDKYNAFESESQGSDIYLNHLTLEPSEFRTAIQSALDATGNPQQLDVNNIVNRAEFQSCGGCHYNSTGEGMGGSLEFATPFFAQVNETQFTTPGKFDISSALSETFLPHRRSNLVGFLNSPAAPARAFNTTVAPVIDGSLGEASWANPLAIGKVVKTSPNNIASWSAQWDSDFLYVGVRVADSSLRNDSGTSPWDDDSVEVYIDGNNNNGASYEASFDRQFIKRWNDTGLFEKSGRTSGVVSAVARSSGGYTVEMAIPWSNFGVTPNAGTVIGFDVGYNDDDNGGGRDGQAATFGTDNNFASTVAFGNLTLSSTTAATAVSAARATSTPNVDGKLTEADWSLALAQEAVIGTPADKVTTGAIWTDTALIIGARVIDANIVIDSSASTVWEDDTFELFLDGNHNHGTTYDSSDRQFLARAIAGTNRSPVEKSGRVGNTRYAMSVIPGGYSIEISVPWADLGRTPVAGLVLGFDVAVDDDDNGGGRDSQVVRFGTASNFNNTSAFGDLVLAP